jgi:hypothetical protein
MRFLLRETYGFAHPLSSRSLSLTGDADGTLHPPVPETEGPRSVTPRAARSST